MNEIRWPKITAETPIKELQRIHKDIWNYVIEHGEKPETPYSHNCVGCEYAMCLFSRSYDLMRICRYCPIKWPNNGHCWGGMSPYRKWKLEGLTRYAEAVRDRPFKGGSEDV